MTGKELKKVFDKLKHKENPNGKIDKDTVVEITEKEIKLMPKAVKHFTGKDIYLLPLGVGREPFTYVMRVVEK